MTLLRPDAVTVRQRLRTKCPWNAAANGMISPGSSVAYNDYLFSACTAARNCDAMNAAPDPVTAALLNMTEPCGSLEIGGKGLVWSVASKSWQSESTTQPDMACDTSCACSGAPQLHYLPDMGAQTSRCLCCCC